MNKKNNPDLFACSFFRRPITNAVPIRTMSFLDICKYVTSDYSAPTAERLLREGDKVQRTAIKREHLDYCTPAGTFLRRGNDYLRTLSGMMVLDLDNVITPLEVVRTVAGISTWIDSETHTPLRPLCAFVSPSGNGVKILLDIREFFRHYDLGINEHLCQADKVKAIQHYGALFDRIVAASKGKLAVDKSGRDIARACYLCKTQQLCVTNHGYNRWTV